MINDHSLPTEWKEYVCGGSAAIVNIAITFPLNKAMFRQNVHGISISETMKQLYSEGKFKLYRGALPPLGQQVVSRSLMFGNYAFFKRIISYYDDSLNPTLVLATAAFMAGGTEALLTPFERVQVILQDSKQHRNYSSSIDALKKLLKYHGVSELYRGAKSIVIRNGTGTSLFFLEKEYSEKAFHRLGLNSQYFNFINGGVIGAANSTMLYPMKGIIFHLQLKIGGKSLSAMHVINKLIRDRGVIGLWRGAQINCLRSFLSWGIVNSSYEFLHKRLSIQK